MSLSREIEADPTSRFAAEFVSPSQLGDTGITADTNDLLHGEEIAVDILGQVGRSDRSRVQVRVIGNDSMTWVDLCDKWGACVEAVVVDNAQISAYHI